MDLPRCRLVTWEMVERWADRLEAAIRAADRVPQTIVGLTRGGWVPSRLLADRLGVKILYALRAQHWGITATRDGKAELTEKLHTTLEGQAVLVVDDITDTGESLTLAEEHVSSLKPRRLETATFLHLTHSKFRPSYVGEEIPREHWAWFVFPWNYWEDLRVLARKAADEPADPPSIRTTLRERCDLDVPLGDVERALRPG